MRESPPERIKYRLAPTETAVGFYRRKEFVSRKLLKGKTLT
jgi:hypothetical protein